MADLSGMINATNTSYPVRAVDPVFQIVAYTVIGMMSLTCNFIFLYVIFFTYKMKAHQTSLLVNLAISDICIIIVGIPLTVVNLSQKQPITQGILCQAQGFLLLMLFLHSNFNLTYIALQRYLIVVRTKFYPTEMTRTRSALQIMTTWTCAAVVALPSLLGWGKQDYNYGRAHCMLVWGHSISYLLFVQFTAFTIPLVIIIFSYYNIVRYSKRTVVKVKDNPEMKASRKIREYRLSMTLIIVVLTFFTLFMPYAIMLYYEGFGGRLANETWSFVAMLMAYCSSMTDFWIYSYMNVRCCSVIIDAISRRVFRFSHKSEYSTMASSGDYNTETNAAQEKPLKTKDQI